MILKSELKVWVVFFTTIIVACSIHEVGHCIPAWLSGFWAVPTPAKEYISKDIPTGLYQFVALGGVLASIVLCLLTFVLYYSIAFKYKTVIFAGVLSIPGIYSFIFLLNGGRNDNEFKVAQSVLGFDYSGSMLHWVFLCIFFLGIVLWYIKSRPTYKIIGRLLVGFALSIIFIAGLQSINNAIFDPLFHSMSFIPK